MPKKNKQDVKEKVNKEPLNKIIEKEKKQKKINNKLQEKKKLKKRKIYKYKKSYIKAICEVDEIIPKGYILKVIKNPDTKNLDYFINDYIEYITYNNSYQIGDIIEYEFKYPYTQRSTLIEHD